MSNRLLEKAARKAEVKADVDILDMAGDDDCAETRTSVGEREEVRKKGCKECRVVINRMDVDQLSRMMAVQEVDVVVGVTDSVSDGVRTE